MADGGLAFSTTSYCVLKSPLHSEQVALTLGQTGVTRTVPGTKHATHMYLSATPSGLHSNAKFGTDRAEAKARIPTQT